MSERAPDLAYSEEVGKVYEPADYHEAVRILVPVSRNDITPNAHRVVVPKMYREIARAIGRARIAERERCAQEIIQRFGGGSIVRHIAAAIRALAPATTGDIK